ncbi:hypothetical protein [Nonomuraea typhae]|uniref:hypothetical protein n=1 Tax=Nonomuraea typhae TaxID=2603600 RepID=UPI0012FCD9A8|nr:hypothetical protein [Nonomuraea typhae]
MTNTPTTPLNGHRYLDRDTHLTSAEQRLLAELSHITAPQERAQLLGALADVEDDAGYPARARLLCLVAESEELLADEEADPVDPAFEHEIWYRLAVTADRSSRAALLEEIFFEWAQPQFGVEAGILLAIAQTERATCTGQAPTTAEATTLAHPGDRHEPTLRPAPADPPAVPDAEPDTATPAEQLRALLRAAAPALKRALGVGAALLLVALVLLHPSLEVKLAAAAALPIGLLVLVCISFCRSL